MNNEAPTHEQDEAIITLEGEDGHAYSCQILDIFEFDNQEYALLLKKSDNESETQDEDEEGSLVIMRLIQRDDQSIFQTIESDDEFERVVRHVEEIARQSEQEHQSE
jgi:uncharacterized protein YrzB (UPF0473 family)